MAVNQKRLICNRLGWPFHDLAFDYDICIKFLLWGMPTKHMPQRYVPGRYKGVRNKG